MFQSSRIASGIWRRQFSTASSPFSASAIWNSSPSRMRRATLRMTLESSTTKHVFIVSSLYPCAVDAAPMCSLKFFHSRSRRRHLGAKIQHPVDVEDDKELAVEPEYAGRNATELAVEIDRIELALGVGQLEHFAHRIDQKAERLDTGFDPDRHRRHALCPRFQIEPFAQVYRRHDASAQIEDAGDLRPGQRHSRDIGRLEYVLHALDRQTEQLAGGREGDVFGEIC